MTRVTLDSETSTKLGSSSGPVELCDGSGRLLGYFQPVLSQSENEQLLAECPFTEEELQRRRGVRTGRPLAEILAGLQGR
jgi:hypothetical protein